MIKNPEQKKTDILRIEQYLELCNSIFNLFKAMNRNYLAISRPTI